MFFSRVRRLGIMAMLLPAFIAFVAPILTAIAKEELKSAATGLWSIIKRRLKKEVKEELLEHKLKKAERELVEAVEAGKVEAFIAKYDKDLSSKMKDKLLIVARAQKLFNTVKLLHKKKKYTERAAESFIELAKLLDKLWEGVALETLELKISDTLVEDTETREKVTVTNEEYLIALLLRFAAAVWTQYGKRSTQESQGWALEYDIEFEVPAFEVGGPLRSALTGVVTEYEDFRYSYNKFEALLDHAIRIRDYYLRAVSCLKSAKSRVEAIRGTKQKIHQRMNASHLGALITGFRAEAQYWMFKVHDELGPVLETLKEYLEVKPDMGEEFLGEMKPSKKRHEKLMGALREVYGIFVRKQHRREITEIISDGLAHALNLYTQARNSCKIRKAKAMIQKRIDTLNEEGVMIIDKIPGYLVDEPDQIM